MAATTVTTQRTPRHAYFRQVGQSRSPRGNSLYDLLLQSVINKDAYQVFFDDFHGDALQDLYTAKTGGTSTIAVAASNFAVTTTASDTKYYAIASDLGYSGGQNAMIQARMCTSDITDGYIEFGFMDTIAGVAEVINNSDTPTFTTCTNAVLLSFDPDCAATAKNWNAYAEVATVKKRSLYGSEAADAANTFTATTVTDTGTPWVASQIVGQTIHVGNNDFLVTANTTTVATGTWIRGGVPAAGTAYTWGYSPAAVPVNSTYVTLTVKLEGTVALFYINGVEVAKIPAAVTATTTKLCPWWLYAAHTATGSIGYLDYLWTIQSRNVTA